MMRIILSLGVALWVSGCGGASGDQLRARAAFDLDCPSDKLNVVEIDARTRGVTGCGNRATYVESCAAGSNSSLAKADCTWVMNSDQKRPAAAK